MDWMGTGPGRRPDGKAVVMWNDRHQTMTGLGGSFAFQKAACLLRLPEDTRTFLLDRIFTREHGIGMSVLRLIVGDGGQADWGNAYDGPSDTIEPAPGEFVWDAPDWDTRKETFDQDQVWIAREAVARGVRTILASCWSPPAWMKTNGKVVKGKLRPDRYRAFAEYLAAYVLGYQKHFGIKIDYLSPANEPDLNHNNTYSGCEWTPEEMHLFVRDHLGPVFRQRGVDARIVLPEAMSYGEEYALPTLGDPAALPFVGVVATHAYNLDPWHPTVTDLPVSRAAGIPVWQTEYMGQSGTPNAHHSNTIDDGLKWAALLHDMFTIPDMAAFLWWWPAANNGMDGSDLIRLCNDGTRQSDRPTENGLYRTFKRFYTIGQFSRFIRPGFCRIGTRTQMASGVSVSAYRDPADGAYAIVAVNRGDRDVRIVFELEGFPEGNTAVVPFRTSDSENGKRLAPLSLSRGGFEALLPARSVTTFVPASWAPPDFVAERDLFSGLPASENDGRSGTSGDTQAEGRVLETVRDGDWLRFAKVNFADGSADGSYNRRGRLGLTARLIPLAGGRVEVRIDEPYKGRKIGEFPVVGTGRPGQWVEVSTLLDTRPEEGAYGCHDLYLVFRGEGGRDLFEADRFWFGDGDMPQH